MVRPLPGSRLRKNRKDSRAAKTNWLYSADDVMALYGVNRNTIANWVRYGLTVIEGDRRLFLGKELNAFHSRRALDAKCPCQLTEIYCVYCKAKHSLLIEPFDVEDRGKHRPKILVQCPDRGGTTTKFVSPDDLDKIRMLLESESSAETRD